MMVSGFSSIRCIPCILLLLNLANASYWKNSIRRASTFLPSTSKNELNSKSVLSSHIPMLSLSRGGSSDIKSHEEDTESTASSYKIKETTKHNNEHYRKSVVSLHHTPMLSLSRGGSSDSSVYEEDTEGAPADKKKEVGGDDSREDVEEEWEEDQYDRETITDAIVEDDEEIFEEDDDDDELVAEVAEEVFDNQGIEEDVDDVEQAEDEDKFHDALEELPADGDEDDNESAPLTKVLEQDRMATTDDESSAFVDRMDLADAYDEGETTTAGDESAALAAASAAKVSGGGGDDDDNGEETKEEEKAAGESADVATTGEVTEITDEMKQILRNDLKYTAKEVKLMRPDIAAVVIAKGLQRPTEGVPPNFYVEGAAPSTKSTAMVRGAVIKVSLTLVAVGAIAVVGLNGGNLDFKDAAKPFAFIAAVPSRLMQSTGNKPTKKEPVAVKSSPELVASVPAAESTSSSADEPSSGTTGAEQGDVDDDDDDHPHSVKPYAHHAPSYEEDLDKTWLDKVITKVENAIKAFFRIKI